MIKDKLKNIIRVMSQKTIPNQNTIDKLDAAFRTPKFAMSVYKFLVEAGQIVPKESDEEAKRYFERGLRKKYERA